MTNISNVDANLFVVLDALLSEGSTTLAARRLHVTQSAVSNALARLRALLQDPLFVRVGRGLVPTPRLLELAPRVRQAVQLLESTMSESDAFDPETTRRCFRLACPDSTAFAHAPPLLRLFLQRMPCAQLELVTTDAFVTDGGFMGSEVDAAIGPTFMQGSGLHRLALYDEEPVILVRKGHPTVKRALTRKQFAELPYVEVQVVRKGSLGAEALRKVLEKNRTSLRVVARVPHFLAAAAMVAEGDCITGLPRTFAEEVSRFLPVRVLRFPLTPAPSFPLALVWHERTHSDPGSQFFRALVAEAVKGRAPRVR